MSSSKQRTDYHAKPRPEMIPFLPSHFERVLEVGCGDGDFSLGFAREAEVWGVEPSQAPAAKARERLAHVFACTYDKAEPELPNNYFDLIICNDVIEHIPSHDELLESLRCKLKPDGRLVASVPNVRYLPHLKELLIDSDWHYGDEGILDRTHLRFFTRKSICRSLEEHGFSVECMKGINPAGGLWATLVSIGSALTLGATSDMRFLQFALRARRIR